MASSSGFVELPTEIRALILEELLLVFTPNKWSSPCICLHCGSSGLPRGIKLHPQILRTSQQILAEGLTLLYEKNCFGDGCHNRAQHDDSLSILALMGPTNVSRIKTLRLVGDIEYGGEPGFHFGEVGLYTGNIEYHDGDLQRFRGPDHNTENRILRRLFTTQPNLSNLHYIAISVPDLDSRDLEFHRLLSHLGLRQAWLDLRDEALDFETWEENEDYDRREEEEIMQKVQACALEEIILRAIAVTSQYSPNLTHCYEANHHSTYNNLKSTSRIALLSWKQISDSAECSALQDVPHFNDIVPLDVDVKKAIVKRMTSARPCKSVN